MFRTSLEKSRQFNQSLHQWTGSLPTFTQRGLLAALVLLVLALVLLASPFRPARVQAAPTASMTPTQTPPLQCNGYAYLCDRRYDQVSYLTTHNAFSSYPRIQATFNQYQTLREQLTRGVRGMMLDVYPDSGGLLCHVNCNNGYIPLSEGLGDLKWFLDTHPNEVLSLIFETYVTPDFLVTAFRAANLETYAYRYDGVRWPTLREMINSNKRLIVFFDKLESDGYPIDNVSDGYLNARWLHSEWVHASETPYTYSVWEGEGCQMGADIPNYCRRDRGNENGLFVLNHFVAPAQFTAADAVNQYSYLRPSARYCQAMRNRLPNFVAVDFYERAGAGASNTVNLLNVTALICPDDIVVEIGPNELGANVTFPLSADGGGTSTPASGSFFPPGIWSMPAGNTARATRGCRWYRLANLDRFSDQCTGVRSPGFSRKGRVPRPSG